MPNYNMFKWYTNGTDNIKVFNNEEPPLDFYQGFTLKDETLKRKAREKRTKEIDKAHLKSIPLKERKQVYKQIKYDKLLEKEKRLFFSQVHIPLLDLRIKEDLKKGLSHSQIFENRKLKDNEHAIAFNKLLQDYILEQALIYQLSIMPMYLTTIVDSLKELYSKNKALQHRKDLMSYFTSIFE